MTIRAWLTREPIGLTTLSASIATAADGAIAGFEGVVRAEKNPAGHDLVALDYTAYEQMAETELLRICAAAAAGKEVSTLLAVHRLGRLAIGEASIAIVVAAPHRAAAFDVCRAVIEMTKADLPVFKCEIWSGGDATWVDSL
ncbi:MAG: molybdenum cofactor biosynthesis protein MoaE [Phycisphaerales bacterium]|nr:molybdenum cofactor biosynthesis protein MoaE [Phycisphaerales bacterium]